MPENQKNTNQNSGSAKIRSAYPEMGISGFSRVDGNLEFYTFIRSLIEPSMRVLDYGAGRGEHFEDPESPYRGKLTRLQGEVQEIVGVDIDDAVLKNPGMDRAIVIQLGEDLPFPDNYFDLIYSDWVLEHVDTPEKFAAEVYRVLKPGGWFCARTPNKWGIIGLGARLIPNSLHVRLLKVLQPERQSIDVFPTTYKMNTLGQIRRLFLKDSWNHFSYFSNNEPPYVQRSIILIRLIQLYWRLTPTSLHSVLNMFIQKKA